MKRFLAIFFTIFITNQTYGQLGTQYYASPIDFPIALSGNFGEVRSNHFHSGIDIKTDKVIGKPVFAVADGYVSRISVSGSGYGNAIYIKHPNGTTSVFGHLDKFTKPIADYVSNEQYRHKTFAIELYPNRWLFPLKQGVQFAFSGNTGSSGGPHIHYEIRDAEGRPTNIIADNKLSSTDNIPPTIFALYLIGVDTVQGVPVHSLTNQYKLQKADNGYKISSDETVLIDKPSYFAVQIIDYKNNTSNIFGSYMLEQRIDGKQNFGYKLDKTSFDHGRYINTFTYYPINKGSRYEVIRTYVAPNNILPIYKNVVDRGVVRLADDSIHNVDITIYDDSGNQSSLQFGILRRKPLKSEITQDSTSVPVHWNKNFARRQGGLFVKIPSGALYESGLLKIEEGKTLPGAFSKQYKINNEDYTPLHKYMTLRIKLDSIPSKNREKLCMASINKNRTITYEGGSIDGDEVVATTRTFGTYFVSADTVSPRIVPRFADGADMSSESSISIIIDDNFSGIRKWEVEIDGIWTLFNYDQKSNTITHHFEDARYDIGKMHTLEAKVTDMKGNTKTQKITFLK